MMTTADTDATFPQPRHSPGASVPNATGDMKAIYQRRAVRAYEDRPVSRGDVELLVDAAIHAPSAVNCQPWAFAVVQERGVLARYAADGRKLLLSEPPAIEVAESGLPDMDRLRQMASGPDFELFHGAPALIVIYATSIDGVPDCFLAAENLMLAAWTIGLGTCPIGLARPLFNRAEVKEELNVSREWPCALPIAVGWPDGEVPPTSRRPALIVAWK
jgi:nitroreductase